jgi:photosystem II stability/assembly factor-like uncharacterized protein
VAKESAADRDVTEGKVDAFRQPAAPAAAAAAAPAATPEAAPADQRADSARPARRAANVLAVPEIVSPDPSVRWRIRGAAVEHSSNGGLTWETVRVGVAELTSGTAPTTTVCWLVGRNGVVLLTTDGQTWRRVPFPEITDLSAVRTVDADGRAASVSTSDGRTFVTTDAGVTWSAQ